MKVGVKYKLKYILGLDTMLLIWIIFMSNVSRKLGNKPIVKQDDILPPVKTPAVVKQDTAPEKSSDRSKDEVAKEKNDEVNDTTDEKQVGGGRKKIQTYFPLDAADTPKRDDTTENQTKVTGKNKIQTYFPLPDKSNGKE